MAQQVKVTVTKSDDLSLFPGMKMRNRADCSKLFSDLYTQTMTLPLSLSHTHTGHDINTHTNHDSLFLTHTNNNINTHTHTLKIEF